MSIVSYTATQTQELGRRFASVLKPGDVVILSGDLGAGKTQFVKGVAQGLGVQEEITSPTFNILFAYDSDTFALYHVDLYRLESSEELEDTGIFDLLDSDGVCFIEWGERFADELTDERLDLSFERVAEPNQPAASKDASELEPKPAPEPELELEPARCITAVAHGSRAHELLAAFEQSLGRALQ